MAELKIIVSGAGGRMGAANIVSIAQNSALKLHAAIDRKDSPKIGYDAGLASAISPLDIAITDDIEAALKNADAIIDFSSPKNSVLLAKQAAKLGLIHVIGTTGFSQAQEVELKQAALNGAIIVKSGNMSLGVNLLASLVKKAAKILDEDFDIEIIEMHHRHKVDAPSGTAFLLGEAAADGRNIDLEGNSVRSRDGIIGERKEGTIGFATLRGGAVIGEHSVIFASSSERITLSHKAEDRSLFAKGAIKAALWAKDKKPALYSMDDVLGL
jgi:4-hydroxy-tetrahydrodipicolinate reductase